MISITAVNKGRPEHIDRTKSGGVVFDIQPFSLHDGPGIRTTVFLKGCPLRCLWCHNPESQLASPEIACYSALCTCCGKCLKACPKGCHSLNGVHHLNRVNCINCGACIAACTNGVLEQIGKYMWVEEVMSEVIRDQPFYETTGGGLTLSGGEPMAQFDFSYALLSGAKALGINTCMETAGVGSVTQINKLAPLVDLVLIDCKETNPELHSTFTAFPLEQIVESMYHWDNNGVKLILRCPIVPSLNARPDHFEGIAKLAHSLKNIKEIHLLPYHPLGQAKGQSVNETTQQEKFSTPDAIQREKWSMLLKSLTSVTVQWI